MSIRSNRTDDRDTPMIAIAIFLILFAAFAAAATLHGEESRPDFLPY
jgi:hypothetical protein